MMFLTVLALWIVLPVIAHRLLSTSGRAAVPIVAVGLAIGLAGFALVQIMGPERVTLTGSQTDTYYVIAPSYALLNHALIYLGVASLALVIFHMARGWIYRLLVPAFWTFHLGFAPQVIRHLVKPYFGPSHYADFSYWKMILSPLGSLMSVLGIVCLLALALTALTQQLLFGRKV